MKENKPQQEQSPKKKPKPEQLSRKEIEELMGMNRDTYERRNGALRRR
jgi:hypothetical protein